MGPTSGSEGHEATKGPSSEQKKVSTEISTKIPRRKELTVSNNLTSIGGRLKAFFPCWKQLTSNRHLLQWVKGYRLPLNRALHKNLRFTN